MVTMRDFARWRLVMLAGGLWEIRDPVMEADHRTSLADARAALALAYGVPQRYIDPAYGTEYSPRAYRKVRASWVAHVRSGRPGAVELVAAALDDWLAAAPHVVAAVEEIDPL